MATKIQDAIVAMANGIINYVDFKVDNATFVRTEIGKVKYVTTINGKYTHIVTIRNYDYGGVLSLGNNEFPADSVVYVLVPNGQYNQMFILGYLDDTDAHIKGGSINLGNGNFTVDNNGSVTIKSGSITLGNNFSVTSSGVVTIKTGSINLGSGNFTVDNNGSVTIKSGSITLGSNFEVTSAGAVTIKSGSINLGNNFIVNSQGNVTAKSGYIGNGSSGFTIGENCIYNGTTSISSSTNGIYLGTDGIRLRNRSSGISISYSSGISSDLYGGGLQLMSTGCRTLYYDTGIRMTDTTSSSTSPYDYCYGFFEELGLYYRGQYLLNSSGVLFGTSPNFNGAISSSSQHLILKASNELDYWLELGVQDSRWGLMPYRDTYVNLGTPNHRWGQIYSSSATINTSDKNLKKNIKLLDDLAKDFIMELKPVSFKFKNGESGRTHYGLIAQDVEQTMNKLGITDKDFAGFCKDQKTEPVMITDENGNEVMVSKVIEGEYIYGLRYEEFIAPIIKVVQMQQKEIDKLKDKLGEK